MPHSPRVALVVLVVILGSAAPTRRGSITPRLPGDIRGAAAVRELAKRPP